MKIVIDIPEEMWEQVKDGYVPLGISKYLKNGTPLPKGHGRLIDISKLDDARIESDNPIMYLTINGEYIEAISLDYLGSLQTIIEADTESEE